MSSQRFRNIHEDTPVDYWSIAVFAVSMAAIFGLWGWAIIEGLN